ncbi:thioesterase II family protein [Burkholderia sp. MSMB1826]|uniref:thioesterase II family protein n=1 Tax=Burkholderia sp. MSMB1826 TaxID=1637875 RepID=UPI000B2FB6B9|nr:alpha/beta fold hydrolase [Burkholderia sp. MSMB1826]
MNDSSFVKLAAGTAPYLRLVYFPHGGGGPSACRGWLEQLPPEIESWALCLPGRETRAHLPSTVSLDPLIDALVTDLNALSPLPSVFVGHSLGAALAVELAAALCRTNAHARMPLKLILSGRLPPHARYPVDMLSLEDDAFVTELIRMGGVPAPLAAEPLHLAAFLPRIRADYHLNHATIGRSIEPLDIPITVVNGRHDSLVDAAEVEAWRRYTRREFRNVWVDGGHFFPYQNTACFLALLRSELATVFDSIVSP